MFGHIMRYITCDMTDKEIGIQIKKARAEKGMSQEVLGEKLGVTWEMVSRYENGRSSSRKYLSELSEILEKPISYFFGVQDDLIEYNVEKIASALREKGVGYDGGQQNKVILVDDFSILGFEKSLKLTRQYYSAPEWILEKYPEVFALRLDSIMPESLDVNKGDVGFFTSKVTPNNRDVVLVQSGKNFKLKRFSAKLKDEILAILIVQEKRFR